MHSTIRIIPLKLVPTSGPELRSFELALGKPSIIGRSTACDICLPDEHKSVSRQHARIEHRADSWHITDLASKHGTLLNGVRLRADAPAALGQGDALGIGPWTFRVMGATDSLPSLTTTDDSAFAAMRVQHVPSDELNSLARQRLSLLMDCAAAIQAAQEEQALASAVLEAALSGTGYARAALVRHSGSDLEVEVIARAGAGDVSAFSLSRSLIRAAAAGHVVRLADSAPLREAVSIAALGIHGAICAPVHVGAAVAAYIYLDARAADRNVQPDAAAFCTAIARLCGLALANLRRKSLEDRQRQLDADLRAARQAQQRLMPPERGVIGPATYAMRSLPGRLVAGDLFDAMPLDASRAAFFLGDVSGKGIGAALLMAAAQTELRASLRTGADPASAAKAVNDYIHARSADSEFVTLWLGVVDAAAGRFKYVDAGHGYCYHKPAGGSARRIMGEGGLPLGVQTGTVYVAEETAIADGDIIVMISDGVAEQPNPDGDSFGEARILAALDRMPPGEPDATAIIDELRAFAESEDLADDVTIALIHLKLP